MTCSCGYGGICSVHPRCPWCHNEVTVFASGRKEWRCTRCKKVFDKKTSTDTTTKATKANSGHQKKEQGRTVAKQTKTVERESSLRYAFLKAPKEMPETDTILGCVLSGIKKIKTGSLDEATDATRKCGFDKISDQDARQKTRIMLRRLANEGFIKITREGAATNGASKKVAKVTTKKGGKKSFKLVKK